MTRKAGLQAFHDVAVSATEIPGCQALGKKVILSIGGGAGIYGFRSAAAAVRLFPHLFAPRVPLLTSG